MDCVDLVLVLGLGLGLVLYCKIWRPLALPYMCLLLTGPPSPELPSVYSGEGKHAHNRRALAVVSASLVNGHGQLYAALCMVLAVSVIIGTHCHLE